MVLKTKGNRNATMKNSFSGITIRPLVGGMSQTP